MGKTKKKIQYGTNTLPYSVYDFWPDCKAIPAYGVMMSVCQHFG